MAADIRRRPVATCGGYCYAMPPHSGALVSSAGRKRPATLLMLPPLEIGRIAAVFPAVRFRHIGRRQGQPANIAGRDRRVTPRRHTPRLTRSGRFRAEMIAALLFGIDTEPRL